MGWYMPSITGASASLSGVSVGITPTVLGTVPNGATILVQSSLANTATVYVGPEANLSSANGIELAPGGTVSVTYPPSQSDAWYGMTTSGTAVLKVLIV